jgi:sarcosine oxidase, subunit gamma
MHEPAAKPQSVRIVDPAVSLGSSLRVLPPARRLGFTAALEHKAAAARSWEPGFSEVACRAKSAGQSACLWLGPDEFLLISPAEVSFAGALDGVPHSLVDVSHRQIGFELSGLQSATWLNGGCPLDLHPSAFPDGMCTRTLFAKADIVLWRKAIDVFQIEVWRSFYDYTIRMLAEIARE